MMMRMSKCLCAVTNTLCQMSRGKVEAFFIWKSCDSLDSHAKTTGETENESGGARDSQSTCKTWIITILWWVPRNRYYHCSVLFMPFCTHTIWLYNSFVLGRRQCDKREMPKTTTTKILPLTLCQKKKRFCVRFALEHSHTQYRTNCATLSLFVSLHSLPAPFYGRLVSLTVLRIHKLTHSLSGLIHKRAHTHSHSDDGVYFEDGGMACLWNSSSGGGGAAAIASSKCERYTNMCWCVYDERYHNVHRLHDNRILWTSFQSRTRRAVINSCTVDGLTVFFVRLTKLEQAKKKFF